MVSAISLNVVLTDCSFVIKPYSAASKPALPIAHEPEGRLSTTSNSAKYQLVIDVDQYLRSSQAVGMSCRELKQYVVHRMHVHNIDTRVYFTTALSARSQ